MGGRASPVAPPRTISGHSGSPGSPAAPGSAGRVAGGGGSAGRSVKFAETVAQRTFELGPPSPDRAPRRLSDVFKAADAGHAGDGPPRPPSPLSAVAAGGLATSMPPSATAQMPAIDGGPVGVSGGGEGMSGGRVRRPRGSGYTDETALLTGDTPQGGSGGSGGSGGRESSSRMRHRTTSGSEAVLELDPGRAKVREVYGFAGWIATIGAYICYLLWAYLPERVLHSIGVTYYPDRYWAVAAPAMLVMIVSFYTVIFGFLCLAVHPHVDTFDAVSDGYSKPYVIPQETLDRLRRRKAAMVAAAALAAGTGQDHTAASSASSPSATPGGGGGVHRVYRLRSGSSGVTAGGAGGGIGARAQGWSDADASGLDPANSFTHTNGADGHAGAVESLDWLSLAPATAGRGSQGTMRSRSTSPGSDKRAHAATGGRAGMWPSGTSEPRKSAAAWLAVSHAIQRAMTGGGTSPTATESGNGGEPAPVRSILRRPRGAGGPRVTNINGVISGPTPWGRISRHMPTPDIADLPLPAVNRLQFFAPPA